MTLFQGAERLAVLPALGRPTRLGALAELAVSDAARVRAALAAGDVATARAYLSLLLAIDEGLNGTYLEWIAAAVAGTPEPAPTARAVERWKAGLPATEAVAVMTGILEGLDRRSVDDFRGGPGALAARLLAEPRRLHAGIAAVEDFDRYREAVRGRHDLLGRFVAAYAEALAAERGQAEALAIVQKGLESCAALDGLWTFVAAAKPEEVVVLMAEHLRAHLSGPGREGQVTVVEEPDRWRMVFEPCGTGGVLRQAGGPGASPLPAAGRETWGRAGQVPAYCAHCALNEIHSIRLLGHPAWVTEFDPDPRKPCGWTVYKDPKDIPARYYERLGFRKDAARVRNDEGRKRQPPGAY
jgi:hypothetical protein